MYRIKNMIQKCRQKKSIRCRRSRKLLLLVLVLLAVSGGCRREKEPEQEIYTVELPEASYKLYYMNAERTKVICENFDLGFGTAEEKVSRFLSSLEEVLWTEDERNLITGGNPIYEFKLDETGLLTLRFSADYTVSTSITEVLRRAALVKTLCQIKQVTAVEFYIGTQPLLLSNGKPAGMLTADNFIDSTGENTEFYQQTHVTLYFAGETGKTLVKSDLKITFDGTVSTERLILEQMIEGPVLEDMLAVIPEGTVLNKVTVKDGVCYVDFNEKFMEKRNDITPEVALYSIVNTLTELPNIYKVQFLINGATKKNYQNISFSSPFERNLEIVEGEQ